MGVKEIKRPFPYFNKIINETLKDGNVKIDVYKDHIELSIYDNVVDNYIGHKVDKMEEIDIDEGSFVVNYRLLNTTINKIKAKSIFKLIVNNNNLELTVDEEVLKVPIIDSGYIEDTSYEPIAETKDYLLLKTLNINSVFADNGDLDYNNNTFISIKDNSMRVYTAFNYGISRAVSDCISTKNTTLAINSDYLNVISKWTTSIKGLEIKMLENDKYLRLSTGMEYIDIPYKEYDDSIIDKFDGLLNLLSIDDKVPMGTISSIFYKHKNDYKDLKVITLKREEYLLNKDLEVPRVIFGKILKAGDEMIMGTMEHSDKMINRTLIVISEEDDFNSKIILAPIIE